MIALVLSVLFAAADPQGAQASGASAGGAASPAAAPAPSKDDLSRVICKSEDKVGSNIQIRSCKTRAAWEEQERIVRQLFRDAQASGAQGPVSASPPGMGH
jgi:hypothetical protein